MQACSICHHAMVRGQQRGIKQEVIALVYEQADLSSWVGGSRRALQISRRKLGRLQKEGLANRLIERADNVVIIIGSGDTVVTVCHAWKRGRKNYRRDR